MVEQDLTTLLSSQSLDKPIQKYNDPDFKPCLSQQNLNVKNLDVSVNSSSHSTRMKDQTFDRSHPTVPEIEQPSSTHNYGQFPLLELPPEILYNISDHLTLPDLKSLRLVHTLCTTISTHSIQQRNLSCLRFWYCFQRHLFVRSYQSKSDFYGSYNVHQEKSTLAHLIAIYQSSSQQQYPFPCTHYEFLGGDLSAPDANTFFTLPLLRVKTLCVCWSDNGGTSQKTFVHLLHCLKQSLESLTIELFDQVKWTDPSFILLPKLKSLSLGIYTFISNNPPFFKDILNSAPNLQVYQTWFSDVQFIDLFTSSRKIHTIKFLKFSLSPEKIGFFEKFANAAPTLHEIEIDLQNVRKSEGENGDFEKRAAKVLLKILKSSQETLRRVFLISIDSLQGIEWPQMKRLKEFKLDLDYYYARTNFSTINNYLMFPKFVEANQIMPCLKILNLSGFHGWSTYERSFGLNYFPFMGTMPSVKYLELSNFIPLPWLQILPSFVPQVQSLSVGWIRNFSDVTRHLWGFKTVKEMKVEIIMGSEYPQHKYPALDAAFTGLSHEECGSWMKSEASGKVEMDCENETILNLNELEHLKISLRDVFYDVQSPMTELPMNGAVTGKYLSRLMPNLRISFEGIADLRNFEVMDKCVNSFAPYGQTEMRVKANLHPE